MNYLQMFFNSFFLMLICSNFAYSMNGRSNKSTTNPFAPGYVPQKISRFHPTTRTFSNPFELPDPFHQFRNQFILNQHELQQQTQSNSNQKQFYHSSNHSTGVNVWLKENARKFLFKTENENHGDSYEKRETASSKRNHFPRTKTAIQAKNLNPSKIIEIFSSGEVGSSSNQGGNTNFIVLEKRFLKLNSDTKLYLKLEKSVHGRKKFSIQKTGNSNLNFTNIPLPLDAIAFANALNELIQKLQKESL